MTSTIIRIIFTITLMRSIFLLILFLGAAVMNTVYSQTDILKPEAASPNTSRSPIYQLRIYDVPRENAKAFHERFRDHAFRIMNNYGFKIRNMWISELDDKHEFVYLLEWEDELAMNAAWDGFMADEEWASIKAETSKIHGTFVNSIEDRTLISTDYSNSGMVEINFEPTDSASIFSENVISTRYNQRDFILSPAGDELFYTVSHSRGFSVIMHSKKINGFWNRPAIAAFSGQYNDFEPTYSPDGNQIYFSSSRPNRHHPDGGITRIWVVKNEKHGIWGKPELLDIPVDKNVHIFSPTLARNGNLYFNASLPDGIGREDIWMSRFLNGQYAELELLSTAINSSLSEFNAFVCPDEEYLIFTSWGRNDDQGRGDLYISFKNKNGNWDPAIHLGDKINSSGIDYNPYVSSDRKYFFFTSDRFDSSMFGNKKMDRNEFEGRMDHTLNGSTNIYIIDFKEVLKNRD